MSEDQKRQLNQQLWNIANTLRGKMDADEFRDYILGFIFYKYLSEKMGLYANNILREDKIKYLDIDENTDIGMQYLEAINEEALAKLGYFLKPSELFNQVAKRGNGNGKSGSSFIIEDIQRILISIQNSTLGTESEEDFDHLFEDMDLNSTKLGKTAEQRNEVIAKVLSHLDKIDFQLEHTELDVLGDAYEYLIGQFASGAGKKAGEFYTPQQASKILARIVTLGKTKIKSAYDPTCGSGSLILRLGKVCDVLKFYGQERNRTTYNLCRMNMILHGVHFTRFDIKLEDTLEHPQHEKLDAEAVVANPPFSAKWSASPLFMTDDRFSEYGKLAPSSKADFAFIQHMLYHLSENGVMAVVMPHGVLFRSAAEGHIRKYLIEEKNYLDAVIGLPENIFYGTSIPTCILVFKKCREHPEDILFINASQHYEKVKTQNYLRDEDVDSIVEAFVIRKNVDKFCHVASLNEIRDNGYNLNIQRYVNLLEEEEAINLKLTCDLLQDIEIESIRNDKNLKRICEEVSLPFPSGSNLHLLQKYKKGIEQKIFSGEIRFKNDNVKDFPEWEILNGDSIFTTISNKNHNSDLPILAITQEYGAIPRDLIDYKISVTEQSIESYKVVEKGDYIISLRSFQGGIEYSNYRGICSPAYIILRSKREIDDNYFKYYFKTHNFINELNKKLEGIRDGKMISFKYFSEIKLKLPCIQEQKKIANLLSAIDNKINYLQTQMKNDGLRFETKIY
jgi:type I restriction enzyme M protein